MAYVKQVWEDLPSMSSPLSAARMTHLEDGIGNAHDGVDGVAADLSTLSATVAGIADAVQANTDHLSNFSYEELMGAPTGLPRMMGQWDAVLNDPPLSDDGGGEDQRGHMYLVGSAEMIGASAETTMDLVATGGLAVDVDGNFYTLIKANGSLTKTAADGTRTELVAGSGQTGANSMALDINGTPYITKGGVYRVSPTGSLTAVSFTGVNSTTLFYGLAVAADGTIYVDTRTDSLAPHVLRKKAPDGTQTVIDATDSAGGTGIAVDGAGNLYAGNGNQVYKLTPGGLQISVGFTGLTTIKDVAVDGDGNVYVVDSNTKQVHVMSRGGSQTSIGFVGLANPTKLTVAPDGTIYVADGTSGNAVRRLRRKPRPINLGSGIPIAPRSGDILIHDGTRWGVI